MALEAKILPAFGIVNFCCSLEKFPYLLFLYWKWLKHISEVGFMSHALAEASQRQKAACEGKC